MNKYGAEFVGTFALVFAGCGAIIVSDQTGQPGHIGISLVFGLVVMAMIYAVGNVSAAHLNPAVTIGFLFTGMFKRRHAIPYLIAQLAGAFLAAGLLRIIFPDHQTLGATLIADGISVTQAFIMEVVLTFFLVFVILNVAHQGIALAGVAIGGTVGLDALFGGPITGASMNPARSLAPALLSGQLDALWLYIAAPIVGAVLAYGAYHFIQPDQTAESSL